MTNELERGDKSQKFNPEPIRRRLGLDGAEAQALPLKERERLANLLLGIYVVDNLSLRGVSSEIILANCRKLGSEPRPNYLGDKLRAASTLSRFLEG